MAIEIREDTDMEGTKPEQNTNKRKDREKYNNDNKMNNDEINRIHSSTSSFSQNEEQPDNEDEMLSMFADDSYAIARNTDQMQKVWSNIQTYEKASGSQLHEGKNKMIKLDKARTNNETNELLNVNFTIMQYDENETYLGGIIGNNVTEIQTFQKPLQGMEKLGDRWLKECIGIYGREIVSNVLLTAKVTNIASVNGMSKDMKGEILKTIKKIIWRGKGKIPRIRWEIMTREPEEGGAGIKDPLTMIDAAKISTLVKLIIRRRNPWMRWIERKLIRITIEWG